MTAQSDITPLDVADASAFELTDLGTCSYLDAPIERAAASRWAVPERAPVLRSHVNSPHDSGALPSLIVQGSASSAAQTAAPNAAKRLVSGPYERSSADLVRDGFDSETALSADTVPAVTPQRRFEESEPESDSARRAADRLDAALLDFVGETHVRSPNEALELIYGAVFDPEARAAEFKQSERERISSGNHRAVVDEAAPSFSWDDDALDAPIDPEDVRRRLGSRAVGVPQAAIMRRAKSRGPK